MVVSEGVSDSQDEADCQVGDEITKALVGRKTRQRDPKAWEEEVLWMILCWFLGRRTGMPVYTCTTVFPYIYIKCNMTLAWKGNDDDDDDDDDENDVGWDGDKEICVFFVFSLGQTFKA